LEREAERAPLRVYAGKSERVESVNWGQWEICCEREFNPDVCHQGQPTAQHFTHVASPAPAEEEDNQDTARTLFRAELTGGFDGLLIDVANR
jgi:hypothetical protein